MTGRTLAHYELLERIGAGGMGEVFRARDPRLGRDVALKVLPEAVASHPGRLARFEREAKTLAALNHPHIVTIHSIEESGGVRFLTMELVEGKTLDQLVPDEGLPVSRAIDLAVTLADALAAAHDKGIVHRDLKPANVMVTGDGRLKVLDFGLAKPDAPSELEGTQAVTVEQPISTAGVVVGTVPYMAPEQVRGETVDARADLFSFGILLYEMLTGRRPFAGKSFADVSSSILRDTPPPVETIRDDLPRDLRRIVARCLEKDRERRFQTAKDVRNELELVRHDGATGAATGSPAAAAAAPPASAATASGTSTPVSGTTDRTGPAASPEPGAEPPSVAVLPFANRSRDEEDEYFSDGLADELLNVLAKIRGLRVAARTSSATFKGKSVTIEEVGHALNVATVLEGSVRKAGNRVRIAVQLVKVEDGYPLWSETYDRTLDDIFAVQDDIAQSVVKELRTTLLGEQPDSKASGEARAEVAAAAKGRGGNAEAHRLYLQGKHFADRLNPEDAERGIRVLRQALELDPEHVPALVSLAVTYTHAAGWGWMPVFDGVRLARQAAEQAVSLAPESAEAQVALARIRRMHDWDWAGAEAASRRALDLAPDNPEALCEAGVLAQESGRFEDAAALLERAAERDPLSSHIHSKLGYIYRGMDRLDDAAACLRRALDLAPQRVSAHHLLSVVLADQGRDEEALAEAEREPAAWARLTSLAYLHWIAGRKDPSDAALRELKEKYASDSALQIAAVHAVRGETDDAFDWLERALAQRDAGIAQIQGEPTLRALHDDPRWDALVRRIGLGT